MNDRFFALIALPLALCGCASVRGEPAHPLANKRWELREMHSSRETPVVLTQEQAREHTLQFEPDNVLALQLGCNRGTSDWNASNPIEGKGTLHIGLVASTRALCPEPSFGEELAADLPEASAYILSDDRERLSIITRYMLFRFAEAR